MPDQETFRWLITGTPAQQKGVLNFLRMRKISFSRELVPDQSKTCQVAWTHAGCVSIPAKYRAVSNMEVSVPPMDVIVCESCMRHCQKPSLIARWTVTPL